MATEVVSSPIVVTDKGLYCPAGDFYIDPTSPVPKAVVTHGHGDHIVKGCKQYVATPPTADIMASRFDNIIDCQQLAYGEEKTIGKTTVSLHPAGHILGSSQVKIQIDGHTLVITGDFKRDPDPTCRAFEPVECDTLVTEATFALPVFRWPPMDQVARDIASWRTECLKQQKHSVLLCYSLGKAQRLMAALKHHVEEPILVHKATAKICDLYHKFGVGLPPWEAIEDPKAAGAGRVIIAPPAVWKSRWMKQLGPADAAFVSGWNTIRAGRRRRAMGSGFIISDHADWPGLLQTVEESKATKVYVTHGYNDIFARYLNERGVKAAPLESLRPQGAEL